MASKVYEIAFKLAGSMSGGFSKTFSAASKSVTEFQKQINAMNAQAAKMDGVIKARQQTEASRKAYLQAEQRLKSLSQAMANTKSPSAGLVKAFNDQKNATDKARVAYEKNRTSLIDLEKNMGTAKTTTAELVKQQQQLAKATDRARIAQEKQSKTLGNIQKSWAGMKENASYAAMSGAGLGAGIAASVSTAMSFEDQQAELRKYSSESKDIFEGITALTQKYGKTAEDMTNMAAAAMQSGIAKNSKEVLTLVESQTQAAVAFGMTGDEVGEAWANIQSKMGLDVGKTKDVFDIINKLGNETSASSADIIDVLSRQGGTLKGLTALSAEQIAGLAGAFRSAAPSAEVAATSMGTFIGRLTSGSTATKAQQKALGKLGLNSVGLAKQLTGTSESAQKAIQDVFAKINKLPEHEKGAVIGQLFGQEAGIKSAVATLASQGDLLGGNLATVGDKTNYAGSMLAEYQSRADTTSESIKIAQNSIKLFGAQIGIMFLPSIRKAAEALTAGAPKILEWIKNNQGLVKVIAFVSAGIAGLAIAAVPLFIAWKTALFYGNALRLMFNVLTLLTQRNTYAIIANRAALVAQRVAMVASRVAMIAWRGIQIACTAAQWLWNAAMSANPIGLVIIGIAALIAAGILLVKNWDKIWVAIKWVWNGLLGFGKWVVGVLAGMLSGAWQGIQAAFSSYFSAISAIATSLWNTFKSLLSFVVNVFTGKWSAAWQNIKDAFSNAFSGLVGIVKLPFNSIISLVNVAISSINGALSKVKVPDWVPIWGGKSFKFQIPSIPQLASGGIVSSPTLAMIGEGNESEAVLPLSQLKSLIGSTSSGGGITVNFSPIINVTGSGSDVEAGITAGVQNLKRELQKLIQQERRVSYA